ncbi:MAG: hypothetical protein L6R39_001949 [Caloplaca ligustica]|nr:MAG: hypothetical protein L6R39_001949 [Caloplaca ligustica]
MPAPSLAWLARQTIIKNISMLTDVGDIPYDLLRPVLLKIENAKQLQTLEEASPQLRGADEEIWISLIKRDIPDANSNMLYPKNPASWWKVYRKMWRDYQAEADEDAAVLKAAFTTIKAAKDERSIKVMAGIPKLPKLDGMQYAHAAEYNRIKKPPKVIKPPTSLRSGNKKVLTGRGVMEKARREATRFSAQHVLAKPTHMLNGLASRVPRAPGWMVDEARKASLTPPMPIDPTVPKPAFFVPPKKRVRSKDTQRNSNGTIAEERERRLRTLTNPNSAAKAADTTPSSATATAPRSSAKRPSPTATTPASTSSTAHALPAKRPSPTATIPSSTSSTAHGLPAKKPSPTAITPSTAHRLSAKQLSTTTTTPSSTSPTAPRRSAKSPTVSSSATASHSPSTYFSHLMSKSSSIKAPTATPAGSKSTGLKRKAEDVPMPSVEVDDSGSTCGQTGGTPSPSKYRIPRLSRSPSTSAVRPPMKKKSPVNVFMPNKKRRMS